MKIPEFIRNLRGRDLALAAGAVASGLMLASSFAPLEWADAAWFCFLPLLVACTFAGVRDAARLGWLAGLAFWLASMIWLTRVTVIGWLLLCCYCALYFIPLAAFTSWWIREYDVRNFFRNVLYMVGAACIWIASEYARFHLFTGFPWNPIGASQAFNLAFIQHASWGSVYSLGGLLMFTNAAIALTVLRYVRKHARFGRTPHVELLLAMMLILVCFVTGSRIYRESVPMGEEVRIALVQPAIPQQEKWTEDSEEKIYRRLEELTSQAVLWTKPDLAVWPETALPYDVRLSDVWYELVYNLSRLGSPLLVGSMDTETFADRDPRYYNSSFLFDTNGVIIAEYDKNHLVLLGEYVPLHEYVDIVNAFTPVMESFSPGQTNTVFELPGRAVTFSSLICFEDTMPYLARRSVRNGARLLINQTNDAWFDPSSASRQHMALSVFRTVENRVPMVRSANTGYSCHINSMGTVRESLVGEGGNHDAPGFQLVTVTVPPAGRPETFYLRHGDVFAWICLAVAIPFLGPVVLACRRRDDAA